MGRMQTPLEKGLKLLCPGSTDSQPGLSPLAPGVGAITVPSLARWDNKEGPANVPRKEGFQSNKRDILKD